MGGVGIRWGSVSWGGAGLLERPVGHRQSLSDGEERPGLHVKPADDDWSPIQEGKHQPLSLALDRHSDPVIHSAAGPRFGPALDSVRQPCLDLTLHLDVIRASALTVLLDSSTATAEEAEASGSFQGLSRVFTSDRTTGAGHDTGVRSGRVFGFTCSAVQTAGELASDPGDPLPGQRIATLH